MKIQYASDLHLEFPHNTEYLKKHPLKPVGDILILAGDIIAWDEDFFDHPFFDYISDHFQCTYYLPGNHEFYQCVDIKILRKSVFEEIRKNVYLVSDVVINIGATDLIFTPLWSKISPDEVMFVKNGVNDFRCVTYRNQVYTVLNHNNFHKRSMNFLRKSIAASEAKTKIVITHFVPTKLCNSYIYKNSKINSFFITELYDFIADSDIDYWIYGHNHYNSKDVQIKNTKIITNQLGYVHKERLDFNHKAYIKL